MCSGERGGLLTSLEIVSPYSKFFLPRSAGAGRPQQKHAADHSTISVVSGRGAARRVAGVFVWWLFDGKEGPNHKESRARSERHAARNSLPFSTCIARSTVCSTTHSAASTLVLWFGTVLWPGPSLEVSESDRDYTVTAELPGLEEKDVQVEFVDGVLVMKGEEKTETEDKDRRFSERTYGQFERRIPLEGIDIDKVTAASRTAS